MGVVTASPAGQTRLAAGWNVKAPYRALCRRIYLADRGMMDENRALIKVGTPPDRLRYYIDVVEEHRPH